MSNRSRSLLHILTACMIISICSFGVFGNDDLTSRKIVHDLSTRVKTVCAGRFLIDVPEQAEVSFSIAFFGGFYIGANSPESDEQFQRRLVALENELAGQKNQNGRKNLESVKEVGQPNWKGKIFVYGRRWINMSEGEQKTVAEDVTVQVLVRSGRVSYTMEAKGVDPVAAEWIRKKIAQMRPLVPGEIPDEPGFCAGGVFVGDGGDDARSEWSTMFAGLPGHPDLRMAFSTMSRTSPGPGLLARNARAAAREPFFMRAAFTNLREGKRTINGLGGEELVMRVREFNFTTGYSFDWEMFRKEEDEYAPLVTLELETGVSPRPGGKPVQSSLSEGALMALWDRVSSTIRLRPWRPVKVTQADRNSTAMAPGTVRERR